MSTRTWPVPVALVALGAIPLRAYAIGLAAGTQVFTEGALSTGPRQAGALS